MTKPTPVQVASIPEILRGQHVVGGAITGSGKTAAFALPILQQLAVEVYGVFAIVLTPSRELAYQINDSFVALGSPINVRTLIAIGGVHHSAQLEAIAKRPHIVIATPGRLRFLMENFPTELGSVVKHLRYLVLDEADRLTEGDIEEDTKALVGLLGPGKSTRRTLFFTATLAQRLIRPELGLLPLFGITDTKLLSVQNASSAAVEDTNGAKGGQGEAGSQGADEEGVKFHLPPTLSTSYLFVPLSVKLPYLVTALRDRDPQTSIIIFCNSCFRCETVRLTLQLLGFPVCSLNSLLTQQQRLNNLAMFKAGIAKYLVATDIAARGLDIPEVDCVIHYDFPKLCSTYVHRVGRTARAGRTGESIGFVTQHEVFLLHKLERRTGKKLLRYKSKTVNDEAVCDVLDEVSYAKVDAILTLEGRVGDRLSERKSIGAERRASMNKTIRSDGMRKRSRDE
jgi:ATP-dependent RNA helicase DDX49/DBP8